MRLSKFLSLYIAMSRNQARFFIKKGRVSVNGDVITDPNFGLTDTDRVVFDGKPVSIAAHKYFLLHKPATYVCLVKHKKYASALELLNERLEDHYYYFANVLGPELAGLVLLSDDARWTSRMQRRLLKKPCVYHARSKERFGQDKYEQIKSAWLVPSESKTGRITEIKKQDERTLVLSTSLPQVQGMTEIFSSVDLSLDALRLQQLGRLSLGSLAEGEYLELNESEIEI
ncbi:MAG: hypothetical protein CMD92_05455 [Gammaproteobacteria bacterium]|nr:hypothetical protein [Gammaproteobacteria bacterium]